MHMQQQSENERKKKEGLKLPPMGGRPSDHCICSPFANRNTNYWNHTTESALVLYVIYPCLKCNTSFFYNCRNKSVVNLHDNQNSIKLNCKMLLKKNTAKRTLDSHLFSFDVGHFIYARFHPLATIFVFFRKDSFFFIQVRIV